MDDIRGTRSDIPIEDYHWGRGFFRAWLIVSAIWIAFAGCLALVGLAGYVYWVEPWVLWYAHKNNVPPEKVYIDPELKDCNFWHWPVDDPLGQLKGGALICNSGVISSKYLLLPLP